jgi:hypothetical protein
LEHGDQVTCGEKISGDFVMPRCDCTELFGPTEEILETGQPYDIVLQGSQRQAEFSLPEFGSCNPDIVRVSKLQHAVQPTNRNRHFGGSTVVFAKPQFVADDLLVAADRGLDFGTPVVGLN